MPFLAPVFGAIAAGGWVTQLVVGVGLSVVSTLLSNALRPKPQAQKQRDPGVSLTMQIGGNNPLSFIVGLSATAGHRVYAGSWGNVGATPNAYFVDVLELANAPLDGLSGVFVEKERATILWDEAHPEFGYPIAQGRKGGKDHLWVKFYRGDQTTPDAYLRSKFGSHPSRPYDADMVGYGTAYAIVTTRYNRENWNGRPPSMLFEVRGLRCYNIRKDSTAGGSGSHRRNDPATWEWTENPYVIAYNIAFMGVYVGSEWMWGLQNLPILRLPQSAWIAAMNEADRTMAAWGNQKQFTIGGEITVDMQPVDVLDEIAKASLGRFIESAGSYKPRCGLPGASVWSFGEGELLITDPRTITPFPGLEATHNAVEISYSEPGEAWGTKAAPEASDAGMIAADGNRKLPVGLTLGMVSRNEQAQRLAYSYLHDGRRFRTFRGSFHPISWMLEPGDVIDGTILSEGYSGKAFEILEMSGRRTFVQTMTIREVDPDDFDPPESAWQPWSVGPIQTIYPPSQPATGISFAPLTLMDSDNVGRRPGLEGFYQGGMDDVRYFAVQVRRPGDALPFFEGEFPYRADVVGEAAQPIFSQAFLPNMDVEVRGKYVPFTSRETDWRSWMPVKLPNVKLGASDIALDLSNVAKDVLAQIGTSRQVIETFKRIGTLLEEADRESYTKRESLFREIKVELEGLEASFTEIIEVALGPGGAIATALESLYAAMGGNTAEVNVRWHAEAGEGGFGARYVQQAAVNDGQFRAASQWLDVPTDPLQPTMIGWAAGRFAWYTSAGVPIVAMDENGVQRSANNAVMINWVTGAMRNDAV
ncbi:phage tail protein [Devosia honganensis]|uniref:Phage tail protein n=1 Tax=Devosia honganensis TaxID=1610527 RepID=A0ABV7X172_9HYPH